ncbi:MAG: mycothiol synthase [Propioniciclava sp.]|uniref:mycothiol synthase n=1 Tax=Propioniciclava sp. TaxID=2038686 RepID=UPI0039E2F1A8
METSTTLTPGQREAVLALAEAAEASDGVDPLNEEARLQLRTGEARHWIAVAGDTDASGTDAGDAEPEGKTPPEESGGHATVVGYATWQPANATGQIVVHPAHRRRGHGTRLWKALASSAEAPAVWAFGDLPAAQAFARARGLAPTRGLHIMERALTNTEPPAAPEGVTLRGFTDADTEAVLAVNAAAFANHPEQGHFSAADLAARQAEDWWDPDGLILAEDTSGVVGFHWTKRHDATTGEVYVLGVHPRAAGRKLGALLLDAGLARLAAHGNSRVILYVDAGNDAAVRLYQRAGFTIVHTDTLYRA